MSLPNDKVFWLLAIFVLIHILEVIGQQLANDRADLDSLKFVHALWRHGDRTPSKMIPSDQTNTLDKWKAKFGGLGQLTADGAQQHFNLGRLMRLRYNGFLSCKFTPEEFVYRSSDYNRTKMSAIANLQGLFSPDSQKGPKMPLEENAPKGLELCFLPQGHDPIVFDDVECPAASKAEDELFSSDNFKKVHEERNNEKVLTFLGQKAQYGQVPHPLRRIYYVHDPLNSINAHRKDGFMLPDWLNETMRQEIFRLYNLKNSFNYKVDIIKRLWAGPLFTETLDRMDDIVKGNYKGKEKFHAYSGHDGSIAGLLAILDIYPDVFPTYANALLLELHQQPLSRTIGYNRGSSRMEQNEPFVRLFHKNTTEGVALREFQIPNCGPPCTLQKLRETRKAFVVKMPQWKKECEEGKTDKQ